MMPLERKKAMRKKASWVKDCFKRFAARGTFRPSGPAASREENLAVYRRARLKNEGACPNRPLHLLVEVTSKCNLSCKMCNVHYDTKSGITIPDALLEGTFELARSAKTVSPFGLGEPLLHPRIVEIVGKYKSMGLSVGFTTNGMLLSEKISRGLIINGLDQLAISIDAAEPVLFSEIRRGADLKRISENIMALNRLKRSLQSKSPALALSVVAQASNLHQLPQIIQLADKWDIRFLTYVPVTAHKHISEIQHEALGPLFPRGKEIIERCHRDAEMRGIKIDTQRVDYVLNGSDWEEVYGETTPCPEPFRFMVIRANGDIFPCCNWDLNKPVAKISVSGELSVTDLENAWHDAQWEALRGRIVLRDYPEACKTCMANFTRPFRDEDLEED